MLISKLRKWFSSVLQEAAMMWILKKWWPFTLLQIFLTKKCRSCVDKTSKNPGTLKRRHYSVGSIQVVILWEKKSLAFNSFSFFLGTSQKRWTNTNTDFKKMFVYFLHSLILLYSLFNFHMPSMLNTKTDIKD